MRLHNRDNTVIQALHRQYQIAILVVLLVFASFLLSTETISRMYASSTDDLTAINELESTFIEMNNSVNLAYNFLSSDGAAACRETSETLGRQLQIIQERGGADYERDVEDLVSTLETFKEQSVALMDLIDDYTSHNRIRAVTEEDLAQSYEDLQQIYGYTVQRFQDSYSAHLTRYTQEQEALNRFRYALTAVAATILILVILVFVQLTRHITSNITGAVDTLQNGVSEMEQSIETFRPIALSSYDEFNRLAEAYNSMQVMILSQMRKIQENAGVGERLALAENKNLRLYAQMQKNHLDFLQSRINPHFLFNALNMISSMAHIEGAEKSAELMETTAQFLRYNLDNISKTMTLRDELRNLYDYIEIQKCRYDDRYQFEYDLDPACDAQEMPCMVLQPLVENAIQHGVGMRLEGGVIRTSTRRQQDRVIIAVYDNGIGMTREQIDAVKQDIENAHSANTHIGLRNIYRRLVLFYKGDVLLDIRQEDPGVTISLSLPITMSTETTDRDIQEATDGETEVMADGGTQEAGDEES